MRRSERPHGWMRELAAWRRDAGKEGGVVNARTAVYEAGSGDVGSRSNAAAATTFTFVTEGPQVALDLAREAARGRDVAVSGGAGVARQFLCVGLVDELTIHLVPALSAGR